MKISTIIEGDLLMAIEGMAKAEGRSMSSLLRWALMRLVAEAPIASGQGITDATKKLLQHHSRISGEPKI